LVWKVPSFQFGSDDQLPAAYLCFASAPVIVAVANLPCQASLVSNLRDVFISKRWITGINETENGRDRRRDYNLYSFAKTAHKQIAGRIAIIGAIRQKAANRSVNLIEKFGQSSWVAHVVFCQVGTNDISSCDVQSKMQLAPRLTFGLFLCLFCNHSPSPNIFRPLVFTTNSIGPALWPLDFSDMLSPAPLRERVEKSGTGTFSPISRAKLPTNPCVCRKGCLKTIPSVRHTDMTISEYVGWPPGVCRLSASHLSSTSGLNQIVTSPR
jgi:hypothetical protein